MVQFELNGVAVTTDSPDDTLLLWVIRDELKLKGTKFGCGIAMCGACTVHLEGEPTRSCVTTVGSVAGQSVTTIEGLESAAGAIAQAEGASLWGVSLALHESTAFIDAQVKDQNLNTYTPLRMSDVPELDIKFIESTEFPMGLGEPPLIAVPPAIGNAVYAVTGSRIRDLPIRI